MLRISGLLINPKYKLLQGLCKVYGIGKSRAGKLISYLGLSPNMKVGDLTPVQTKRILDWLSDAEINSSEIKKTNGESIILLKEMKSYRGSRHKSGFPVRGQRTKTNAKTQRRIGKKHANF